MDVIDITGKQRRRLRAIGQSLGATVHVGRAGLTEAVRAELDARFARAELVKVRLPDNAKGAERKAIAAETARQARAALAGVVGRTALLYRPNESLPIEDRVDLDG